MSELPDVLAMESACFSAWPALRTAVDRSWVWRWADGYSGRANSINCLDPADGVDAGRRIAAMVALSDAHALPPLFRVTPLTAPPAVDALDALGWATLDRSEVLALPLAATHGETGPRAEFLDPTMPEWHAVQAGFNRYGDAKAATQLRIIDAIAVKKCGVLALDADGVPVASALVGVAFDIAVFLSVVVDPLRRGEGHGRSVMVAAMHWALEAGAHSGSLQVAADNAVAKRLYSALGFQRVYAYHYRRPTR